MRLRDAAEVWLGSDDYSTLVIESHCLIPLQAPVVYMNEDTGSWLRDWLLENTYVNTVYELNGNAHRSTKNVRPSRSKRYRPARSTDPQRSSLIQKLARYRTYNPNQVRSQPGGFVMAIEGQDSINMQEPGAGSGLLGRSISWCLGRSFMVLFTAPRCGRGGYRRCLKTLGKVGLRWGLGQVAECPKRFIDRSTISADLEGGKTT